MNSRLLEVLASPCCKADLSIKINQFHENMHHANQQKIISGILTCVKCGKGYPILDSVPRLCLELMKEEKVALSILREKNEVIAVPEKMAVSNYTASAQIEKIVRNKISIPLNASNYLKNRIKNDIFCRIEGCEKQEKYVYTLTAYYKGPFKHILEIGGGQGGLAKCLISNLCPDLYVMVDIDLEWIRAACIRNPNADIIRGDAVNLPIIDESFDVVISQSMLEHIREYSMALHEMCRVTRKALFVSWGPNKYFVYDFGHLDAPITIFPKNIAKNIAIFWHKVCNTRRTKESIASEINDTFYISTISVYRLLRNYGRVFNVFTEFCMNSLKSEYSYMYRDLRRLLKNSPFFSKQIFKLLAFFHIEPQCYYILIKDYKKGKKLCQNL